MFLRPISRCAAWFLSAPTLAALLMVSGIPQPLHAQVNAQANLVRSLNDQLLQTHDQLLRGNAANAPGIQLQAAPLIAKRAAALATLMDQDPEQALSFAFSPALITTLTSAFPQAASQLESHGVWQGPVDYLIADDLKNKRSKSILRMKMAQEVLTLHLSGPEPQGLKCGSVLKVQGIRVGTEVAAMGSTVQTTLAAAAGTCTPIGVQNTAVLLVTFPGVPAPDLTRQSVYDIFFSPSGHSLDSYWREASYNRTSASGNVFGWFTLDRVYSCDEPMSMMDAAIRAADSQVDFRQYSRVVIVFADTGGCSWAGLASVGCMGLSSPGDGLFTSSVAWLLSTYVAPRDSGVMLAAHEAGHTLGMDHASARSFGTEALGPIGASGTLYEYGDERSSMGSWNFGHYAAGHKALIGWLDAGTGVQTVQTSGTFTLQPVENTGGVRALKIQRGSAQNAWLWVEYRQPVGLYESTLPLQTFAGALIHYEDSSVGLKTHLLNMNPQILSWSDVVLRAGSTWTDPYTGLSIVVSNATANDLTLNVTYGGGGPPPCVSATPSLSVSPSNPTVIAGSSVAYTAVLTNNDSTGCSSKFFAMTASAPTGWSSTFSPETLTLAPGQSGSVTPTESVPAATLPATYPLSISAAAGTSVATASANATVIAAPVCTAAVPTVTISPLNPSVVAGSSVVYTITVTNRNSSACATSTFNLSSAVPSGWASTVTPASLMLASGQSGSATLTKVVPAAATAGSYLVSLAAANGGYVGTGTASCTILAPPPPPPSCVESAATIAMSPASLSAAAGASITYAISVTNNDSAECAAGTFNLSSAAPAGWASSISPLSLNLAPGASGSATLMKTIPAGAAAGTYTINGRVVHGSFTTNAAAACSVTTQPPPPPPSPTTVTASLSAASYPERSNVYVGASVTTGNTPVAGATVVFTINGPHGRLDSGSAVTDSNGRAGWDYRLKNQKGTYSVTAKTIISGQTFTSTPLTFVVY